MDYEITGVDRYGLNHKKGERYYVDEARWMSYYYQMRAILSNAKGGYILEVGPGNNFMKKLLKDSVRKHDTFDIDKNSNPTYSLVSELEAISDELYDLTCAFQVLEHMPYQEALQLLDLLFAKTRKTVVLSLPVAIPTWRIFASLPRLRDKKIIINNFFVKKKSPKFDGTHHWELENRGHEIPKFEKYLSKWGDVRSFRNFYNPYHHFFICEKKWSF